MSRCLSLRGACRAFRNTLVFTSMLAGAGALASAAHADPVPANDRMSDAFSLRACYQMVQHEGRMIAWARWEQGLSHEKTRQGKFPEGTPGWMVDIVNAWIDDAYAWRVTDAQIRSWAEELGDASNLPSADKISVHETIAIWMRRLGRDCDAHRDQTRADAVSNVIAARAVEPIPAP
ncbi:MAG TPA: hypothetical protein VFB54_07780 [Burkholderiales bacterium]|nr:hypothetical protein [Burkholderiales bacterium]